MKPNMLLNIIGILLISIGVIGMVVVEEERGTEQYMVRYQQWEIDFDLISEASSNPSVTINDGGTETSSVTIEVNNLTSVAFTVSWNDQYPASRLAGSISVDATVSGPGDIEPETRQGSGRTGSFDFEFEINDTELQKETYEFVGDGDINEELAEEYPGHERGRGVWTVTVSVTRSSPRPIFGSTQLTISHDYEFFTMQEPTLVDEWESFEN
ncbi:MAG: hypothetical protein JSV49_02155 [Thermoplasmata archaeon]|nr:MAG: hypothetical protein JSV49_02155 [Thermoplasmata archaeon]